MPNIPNMPSPPSSAAIAPSASASPSPSPPPSPLETNPLPSRVLSCPIPTVTRSNVIQQARALHFLIDWVTTKSTRGWNAASFEIFESRLSAMVTYMVSLELTSRHAEQKAIFRRHTLECRTLGWSREQILKGQLRDYQKEISGLERHFQTQIYEDLADTEEKAETVIAAMDRAGPRVRFGPGSAVRGLYGVDESTWERWAELQSVEDSLGIPDCDIGGGPRKGGSLGMWIVQARRIGRLQSRQRAICAYPKVTVIVDTSEDVQTDVPMLIVTAPADG